MINKELLQERIAQKLVFVQTNAENDLFIYNYSPEVQYKRLWDEVTSKTRGLILDSDMNCIARPFGKFFNLEEHTPDQIPSLPFDVYEKMDGSLGILYWHNDTPYIATRGSFMSDQAIKATKILHEKYSHIFPVLDKSATYLFEIIYPENRIVVDYGKLEDLVLLTVIDIKTGQERMENIGFPMVKKYDGINDITKLKELSEDNKEGFVIRFNNGFRVKVKFEEYVRLHRIITGVSNVAIWEYLSEGRSFSELLEKVPDEFYQWVRLTRNELVDKFSAIVNECNEVFAEYPTRKETAIYFQTQKYPSVLFSMLDGKRYEDVVWKLVRPKYSKPFKAEVEC